MGNLFNTLINQPILESLIFFYHLLGDNLGLAIIAVTLAIRFILLPLTLPAIKSAHKVKELKPELDKLKKQHKDNKQELYQAQMKLYQEHNINPAAGCLPYLVQFIVLIGLYHVFINFLSDSQVNGVSIDTSFLGLTLNQPDSSFVLPVLAAATQLVLAVMVLPGAEHHSDQDLTKSAKAGEKIDESKSTKESIEDIAEMAQSMQQQMVFLMPIMTFFIALQFPAGLALYWIVTTVFSVVQQYYVSGPGGIAVYARKFKLIK